MGRFKFAALVFAVALAVSAAASSESVNFTTTAPGTAVTSAPGVTFDLQGGPDSSGPPTIGGYYCPTCGLTNSTNGGAGITSYPTASILDIAFTSPADNWGSGNGTYYTAWDGATVVSSGLADTTAGSFALYAVSGSDITDLQINNNTGGDSNWVFGVGELNFTPTPEPSSLLLFGTGILAMAGLFGRKILAM